MQQQGKVGKSLFLDLSIVIPFSILSIMGLVMVFSATSWHLGVAGLSVMSQTINQAIWLGLGLVVMFLIYRMKSQALFSPTMARLLMFIVLGLLVLTMLFGIEVNGAQGWLPTPVGNIQAAEYLKVIIPIYFGVVFTKNQRKIARKDWSDKLTIFTLPFIQLILVAAQPDLGNATITMLLIISLVLVSGIAYRYSYVVLGLIIGGSIAMIELILWTEGAIIPGPFSYIFTRFEAMATTFQESTFLGAGHQLAMGYFAFHNGGLFGLGLGNSIQKQGFLPEAHTDFVFAITVEELGLVGGVIILGILLFMVSRMYLVAIRAQRTQNVIIAFGMATMILLSVFVNLGGVLGLIPSTGVTFPFLSQGGNSLFVFCVAVGIVLNISADETRLRLEQQVYYEHYQEMEHQTA